MPHPSIPRNQSNRSIDRAAERAKRLMAAGYDFTQAVAQAARDYAVEFDHVRQEMSRRAQEHRASIARRRK